MRRRFMVASALVSLTVLAPAAWGQREISEDTTDPIATSTAGDGGGADDIVITNTGRVILTTVGTPAVTLDSDNTIEQNGFVTVTTDEDGGIGVHIQGGNTGSFTSQSSIQVLSESRPEDTDDDGDLDGPGAIGGNRVGVLVDGTEAFHGDLTFNPGSSIVVMGNHSAGLRILTTLDGTLDYGGRGTIVGDQSAAIDIQADITGNFYLSGAIIGSGENTRGVSVAGDVGGAIAVGGSIATTGYQYNGIPTDTLLETLDEDDIRQGGTAFYLSGSVAEGLLFHGPTTEDPEVVAADISVRGSAYAVHLQATAASGDIILSEVIIPAVEDDPDTEDTDESRDAQFLGYSFVNRGTFRTTGELDGISATALRIEGGDGFTTTLEDGFLNEGTITATSVEGEANAIQLGNGAIIPLWTNTGNILSTSYGVGGSSTVMLIEVGAALSTLVNEETIFAYGRTGGSAYGIRDLSGSLTSVTNSGIISTLYEAPVDDTTPVPYETVALDLSAGTQNTTVRQFRQADADEDHVVSIIGDVRFGSGDDQFLVESGTVTGDMSFGDGADLLAISGGAEVSGAITDSDGDLIITVGDGSLELGAGTADVRQATFSDGSRLTFQVDHENGIAALLNASETVTFESGSAITTSLTNLIGDGASYVILTANSLVIEESLDALQDTTAPYLYHAEIDFDPNDSNSLILTLRRKTTQELGMNANQTVAYNAAYAGWVDNAELGAAIASLTSESAFFDAYNQLMPEYAASAIQFALASNDSAVGALATRLEAVRRSPEDSAGLWVQEFGYFADRAGTAFGPGYRGHGMGVALGVDRPAGPFYALGLNFVGAASEITESDGVDEPMSALTAQIGAYAGAELGGMNFDFYGGAGYDSFEHNRRVLIGTFDSTTAGEWDGYHIAGSARIGRDFTSGRYYFRPALSVDYLNLFESAYTETGGGTGIDLVIDDRESSSFSGTALFTFGAMFDNGASWWAPHIRLGYRNEFGDSETETLARFDGYNDTFTLRSEQLPGTGFIFGFGIGGGSDYSTFSFDYDADLRDDFIRHTARLVMRLVF